MLLLIRQQYVLKSTFGITHVGIFEAEKTHAVEKLN